VTGRRSLLTWTTRPLLVGGAAALIAWLLGVIPTDALLIGVLIGLVVAVPNRLGPPEDMAWTREEETQRPRSWTEPTRLARLLGSEDAIRHVLPRARWTAHQRVSNAGMAWMDPRVRTVLGPALHDALSTTRDDLPSPADPIRWVNDLLDRLDQLDAPPSTTHDTTIDEEPDR
jgi:hypothetical protein